MDFDLGHAGGDVSMLAQGSIFFGILGVTSGRAWPTSIAMFTNRITCGLLPVALLSGITVGQEFLYDAGFHPGDIVGVGQDMANLGDVNGDGVDDFLIGLPWHSANGSGAGAVHAISGTDGAHIYSRNGAQGESFGQVLEAIGDVNSDGISDWAVGLPSTSLGLQPGEARVFSGSDGAYLYSVFGRVGESLFGTAITGLPDWNGDGIDDWAVSTQGVRAQVLSGMDGGLLREFIAPFHAINFGVDLKDGGDWNQDGIPDLAVGNPYSLGNSLGQVLIYSGAPFAGIVGGMLGFSPGFGSDFVRIDDWNGDGLEDWALMDPDSNFVQIHAGGNGALIRQFPSALQGSGGTIWTIGDVNGDGFRELAISSRHEGLGIGSVRILAGGSGRQIMTVLGERGVGNVPIGLGLAVLDAGDINSDGFDDFLISKWRSGTVTAYAGGPGSVLGDSFENPIPIPSFGSAAFDTTLLSASSFPREGTCDPIVGKDIFFLWYPNGRATLTTEGSSFDTILTVIEDVHDLASCILSNDDLGIPGRTDSLIFDGFSVGYNTARIVRIGGDVNQFGPGALTIEDTPYDCPNLVEDRFAGNHDCANARDLPSYYEPDLVAFDSAPDYFSVCVPPGSSLPVTIRSRNFRPIRVQASLWLADANQCGDASVWLPLTTSYTVGLSEEMGWINLSDVSQRVLVKIETNPGEVCGEYSILVSFTPMLDCMPSAGGAYCSARVNSTGLPASLEGRGSNMVMDDELQLLAKQLPTGQAIYFLASQGQGLIANPGGSQGDLCLGSGASILRLHGTFGIAYSGYHRAIVPLTAMPDPALGLVPVQAGETWLFQGWYRDGNSSNFTPGLSVVFQ